MYELVKVSENCYYIQSPAKIGIVKLSENEVLMIDSGSDKDAAKKALKHLDANGWTLKAVINTHSHADHIGGNKLIEERTGAKIYAPDGEIGFVRHPVYEPSFLYGGYPFNELRHKFLMANESNALPLSEYSLPDGFEIIKMPGHFFNMVGIRTPDDIVYLADCLSSKETLEKYRIGFIYDVKAYLETLEAVKGMSAKLFVPSHAEAQEDIASLAQYNIDAVNNVALDILNICSEPLCFEDILCRLFKRYELKMTFEQYVLVGSTLRSYLAWLKDSGKLDAFIEDCKLLWKTC